ncbi:hypothetical protein [Streptomyces mayteni]
MSAYKVRSGPVASAIAVVVDIAAAVIGLWILMYLLDANPDNDLVSLLRHLSRWLASGLAAVVYLFVGHLVASRVRRL